MTVILGWLGIKPQSVGPAVAAFFESLWRSSVTVATSMLAVAYTNGDLATPQKFVAWMAISWWPFLLALFVVPLVQGTKVVKQISSQTPPTPPA